MTEKETETSNLGGDLDENEEALIEATEDEQETTEQDETEEQPEKAEAEESQEPEAKDGKQKRIDKLTAINKTLQEQLQEAKSSLDDAREQITLLNEAYLEAKQSYADGLPVEKVWTRQDGKHMYELTEKEFQSVIDPYLDVMTTSDDAQERTKARQMVKELRLLRDKGETLKERDTKIDSSEFELWRYEWGIITTACIAEAPELEKEIPKLAKHIAPIFANRKQDVEAKVLYRKLTEGGVDAKMRYLSRLMRDLGLYEKSASPNPDIETVGKGNKTPATAGKAPAFTRAQISKMSVEEFTKNEAAIDKAAREGRIR